jgi:4-oxalocrotonate tautomerase
MPYIAFESGQLRPGVKERLITQLTEVGAHVTGIPKEYFLVTIRELPDSDIAIGGQSVIELKAELQRKTATSPPEF